MAASCAGWKVYKIFDTILDSNNDKGNDGDVIFANVH